MAIWGRLLPLIALPLIGLVPLGGRAPYSEGPPVAHTGGFGEPTCRACHFDNPLDEPSGTLAVNGLPERYAPGESYRLVVALARPGMERAGFQLAVRYAAGARAGQMAGTVVATDDRVTVVTAAAGVAYAQQTARGAALTRADSSHWTVEWRAPAEGDEVALHVVGNAGNGDQSEFGDYVYARELRVQPASQRHPVRK